MKIYWLDFEKPLLELEKEIENLKKLAKDESLEVIEEIKLLEEKAEKLRNEICSHLTRDQRVKLARHPNRPYTLDFVQLMTTGFTELHGDRVFGDDKAIVGGFAWLDDKPVMIIGHQKGRDMKSNLYRNFGMAHPEGYRKAIRLMQLSAKFNRPIITFIDTPGAYPGIEAEERGQAEAIARNLREMAVLPVPFIAVIIGEGGSGGALAIGTGNRVLMLENAIYSVISPEGCAAILWKDSSKAPLAAEAMKITAKDIYELGIVDEIIPEPVGGSHRDFKTTAENLKQAILKHLKDLEKLTPDELINQRIDKYLKMGVFTQL